MKKGNLIFYGNTHDQYGMPVPFQNYIIFASAIEPNGMGFSTCLSISGNLDSQSIAVKGDEDDAFKEMIEKLKEQNFYDGKKIKMKLNADK